jgi:hypothetical protein
MHAPRESRALLWCGPKAGGYEKAPHSIVAIRESIDSVDATTAQCRRATLITPSRLAKGEAEEVPPQICNHPFP